MKNIDGRQDMLGYRFKCSKCGTEYEAFWGDDPMNTGFGEEYRKAIREGKYGPARQKLLLENPDILMNTTERLYVCGHCGSWKVECDMGLYAPRVNHLGEVWWARNLKDEYRIVFKSFHKCDRCGGRMHIEKDGSQLKCPNCGTMNTGEFEYEQYVY